MDVEELIRAESYDLLITDGKLPGPGLGAERADTPWVSYIDFFYGNHAVDREAWKGEWDRIRARLGLGEDGRSPQEARWLTLSSHLTLVFGLPEMLRYSALPPYVHEVGPVSWDPPLEGAAPPWLENLGRTRPAILVSTSSCWIDDLSLVTLAEEALQGDNIDIVATVPTRQHLTISSPRLFVAEYLPHTLLLPRVEVVLCSAGLLVVTRGVLSGLPIVAVPRGGDGYMVAAAAARAGVAIALDWRHLAPQRLREALVEAMRDQSMYKRSAERLAKTGHSFNAPGTSADLIELLLDRSSSRRPRTNARSYQIGARK
jgi:UDP:flavonoid glycosyltransferase YjiC (YdhE family)